MEMYKCSAFSTLDPQRYPTGCICIPTCEKLSRKELVKKLQRQLRESLEFAHSKGYCHRDLRPDNVIYDVDKKVFVIIDWGLGAKVNSSMHKYDGGIDFFHDTIVQYFHDEKIEPLPYTTEFDHASASYVVYAFKRGSSNLSVPWQFDNSGGEDLIAKRNEYMNGDK